jgi:hypothetical protein
MAGRWIATVVPEISAETVAASVVGQTAPRYFLRAARSHPELIALRSRANTPDGDGDGDGGEGITWNEWTMRELAELCARASGC